MHKLYLMKNIVFIVLSIALALSITSCRNNAGTAGSEEISELLDAAGKDVQSQRFDSAMDKALLALTLSRSGKNDLGEVRALSCIAGIGIMTSRDDDAWGKALEAESIARKHGFKEELSGILITKAKLCSYAEISPETGRNDEGLVYAHEALSFAEETAEYEKQAEACYVIASLLINKNRWSDPIDPELYRSAGQWLDRGQAIADTYDIARLKRNGILFRSRWFQQGGRNEEAIRYFEQVKASLTETDYLTASALDDRLVRLYTRSGDSQKALDAHDDYVLEMQKYIRQKEDDSLQEMETRFEVHQKERRIERNRYQIILLLLILLLAGMVIAQGVKHIRKIHRRTDRLQRMNESKEQIIGFLARDLKNPTTAMAGEIAKLSAEASSLSPDEIRQRCTHLASRAEEINSGVAEYVGEVLIKRSENIALTGLTQREIQVIRLSAEGLRVSEIADRINLSVHTVNTHRQHIYAKMDVRNVSDMLRKANELGII